VTRLPEVAGVLSAAELSATVDAIAAEQMPSGLVLWYPGGHSDPWNHVEAAMALAVGGRLSDAERAYDWLVSHQLENGAWHNYYLADGIEDLKLDTNVCAYVAAGVWHHYLLTRDRGFLDTMWPVVERAIDFVLSMQTARGEIIWARHTDGTPWSYALLTGSSSICHSLRCAVAIAETVGEERPDWELATANLAHVVAHVRDAFEPKDRWAMDWYYPVLAGVVTGAAATARLAERTSTFVMEGLGVRCVADRPWITAAETCETAMAQLVAGNEAAALELFTWAQAHRLDDGAYLTGIVYPEGTSFPDAERTSYTAAAVVLAADALSRTTDASGLFRGEDVPAFIDTSDPVTD
jgi:hypothetical protein